MNRKRIAFAWSLAPAIFVFTFMCTPSAWSQTYKVLWAFVPGIYVPSAGLILDKDGNLYGTTLVGGDGGGNVYELTPHSDGTWSNTELHHFGHNDGSHPQAPVAFDGRGRLYTTSRDLGLGGEGALIELVSQSDGTWAALVLHGFTGGWDGGHPEGGVTFDNAGRLYGTTLTGGAHDHGVVFSVNPTSVSTEVILHAFTGGNDGSGPSGLLTLDASGNVYGTTANGGVSGAGVVYKLTRNKLSVGWRESVFYAFTGGADGANPSDGVVFDSAGNLYGVAAAGGNGCGTVFKLAPGSDGSWSESVLHAFAGGSDGCSPLGPLVLDQAGSLYGVTDGAVFKLTPSSGDLWTETILHVFDGVNGDEPNGGLILDSVGNLYGTTQDGGMGCYEFCGVAYEITP